MKATYLGPLKSPDPGRIDQRHWKLSEPHREFEHTFHYVVTSAATVGGVPETYIFGARADGTISLFVELSGSIRGVLDHEAAIRNAGWEIAPALSAECPCGLARVACEYHAP